MSNAQPPGELTRYGANYIAGLTIEADAESDTPRLYIDGQKVEVTRSESGFACSEAGHKFVSPTLRGLADQIIEALWDGKRRMEIRNEHLERLKERDSWNEWRRNNPSIRPLLFDAPLRGKDLSGFNFCNANLIGANLREATLAHANFHEANLGGLVLGLREPQWLDETVERPQRGTGRAEDQRREDDSATKYSHVHSTCACSSRAGREAVPLLIDGTSGYLYPIVSGTARLRVGLQRAICSRAFSRTVVRLKADTTYKKETA